VKNRNYWRLDPEHPKGVDRRIRAVLAGATAAIMWGLQEPVDKRLFRCDYSDVAVLGKGITRSEAWPLVGLGIHAVNGAVFGVAFYEVRRRVSFDSRRLALGMALAEHLVLFPLTYFVDRFHPARGESGVPPLFRNRRAFGQASGPCWADLLSAKVQGSRSTVIRPDGESGRQHRPRRRWWNS
jgi:hypothetical protein